jgi:hypothetical protein
VDAVEFIPRFLLHVLPQAFTRIRHFGLSAGRNVKTKLQTALASRTALTPPPQTLASAAAEKDGRPWWRRLLDRTGIDILESAPLGGAGGLCAAATCNQNSRDDTHNRLTFTIVRSSRSAAGLTLQDGACAIPSPAHTRGPGQAPVARRGAGR